MWWNVGPHLKKRLMNERKARLASSSDSKGGSDLAPKTLQGFLDILKHKFGTVVRAWRKAMDVDQSGTLTFREFSHALERVGYHGDFRSLWYQLDADMSGTISLHEMDPVNAQRLEKFRFMCIKQHGSMKGAWRRVMDVDNSGMCWLHEFQEACQNLGYSDADEIKTLFALLDIDETQQLNFEKVNFLQCWEDEKKLDEFRQRVSTSWVNKDPYMYVGDSTQASQLEKRASKGEVPVFGLSKENEDELRRIFYMCDRGDWLKGIGDHTISVDELVRAVKMNKDVADFLDLKSRADIEKFFADLDSDGNGEVTWEEFKAFYIRESMKKKAKSPKKAKPETPRSQAPETPSKERQLARSGTANLYGSRLALGSVPDPQQETLEDWSAPAGQDHKEQFLHFQRFLEQKYGTLPKAFDAMDLNDSGSLSLVEFQSIVGTLQYVLPSGSVCRASDSKRLFIFAVGSAANATMTWKEFGITPQEWIEHGHFKRRLQMAKQASSAERKGKALADHHRRIQDPLPKTELSFGLPLPKGWGFPPNFHPADSYFGRRHAKGKHGGETNERKDKAEFSPQKSKASPSKAGFGGGGKDEITGTKFRAPDLPETLDSKDLQKGHRATILHEPKEHPSSPQQFSLIPEHLGVEHLMKPESTRASLAGQSPMKKMAYTRGSAMWPGMEIS